MFFLGLVISICLGILLQMIRPGKHSIKKNIDRSGDYRNVLLLYIFLY
jgi:hypothetical protein